MNDIYIYIYIFKFFSSIYMYFSFRPFSFFHNISVWLNFTSIYQSIRLSCGNHIIKRPFISFISRQKKEKTGLTYFLRFPNFFVHLISIYSLVPRDFLNPTLFFTYVMLRYPCPPWMIDKVAEINHMRTIQSRGGEIAGWEQVIKGQVANSKGQNHYFGLSVWKNKIRVCGGAGKASALPKVRP